MLFPFQSYSGHANVELALSSVIEDTLQYVQALEAASATWRPGDGTDTRMNCICTFSIYSGHFNVELALFSVIEDAP